MQKWLLTLMTLIVITSCGTTRVIDCPFDRVVEVVPSPLKQQMSWEEFKAEYVEQKPNVDASVQELSDAPLQALLEEMKKNEYRPYLTNIKHQWSGDDKLQITFQESSLTKADMLEPEFTEITLIRLSDDKTKVTVYCEKKRILKLARRLRWRELTWLQKIETEAKQSISPQ